MKTSAIILTVLLSSSLTGCILAAAGAGAEAGYVLTQEERTAAETLTDQRITASVKTRLLADPAVSGLSINVDTFKSVVSLRGVVDTLEEIEKARAHAQATEGVKEVKLDLHISSKGM